MLALYDRLCTVRVPLAEWLRHRREFVLSLYERLCASGIPLAQRRGKCLVVPVDPQEAVRCGQPVLGMHGEHVAEFGGMGLGEIYFVMLTGPREHDRLIGRDFAGWARSKVKIIKRFDYDSLHA